jgi:1-deoxy-D-xylulose-5-phosphate synthase
LRELLREAIGISDGPTVIRYPKATLGPDIPAVGKVGQCDVLRDDPAAIGLLVAVGALADPCLIAADELAGHNVPVAVVNPRWIAPVDPPTFTSSPGTSCRCRRRLRRGPRQPGQQQAL